MSTTSPPDLASVDLSEPDAFKDGPPFELFAYMREHAPIHRNHSRDDTDFWSLTRYDDVKAVTSDWETFASARDHAFMHDKDPINTVENLQRMMINMDPPNHRRYRGIVKGSFTPGAMNNFEEELATICTELVDRIAERGECDFVQDLAVDLPLLAITKVLGVENPDIRQLYEWTDVLFGAQDPALRPEPDTLEKTMMGIAMYTAGLVVERQESPRDDLLTRIIAAEVDGEHLSIEELVPFFTLLFAAGNETARSTLTLGMYALLQNPGQRQKLVDDPSLIPNAVEEMLRWVSPLMHFRRTATRDTEIAGHPIAEGDKVILWYVSANRDATAFENPDTFDVTRNFDNNVQLAFGNGIHKCLGQHLARLELRLMFKELLPRIPDMELAGEPSWPQSNFFRGLHSLPVRYTPTNGAS